MSPGSRDELSKGLLIDRDGDDDQEQGRRREFLVEGCPGCKCSHLQRPGAPLPKEIMFIMASLMLCNSLPVQILYPYMYFMVEDFNVDKQKIGTYAGLIASGYVLGRTFTSIPWGIIADKYGRKLVLFCGMLSLLVFNTWFGLSKSFLMAFTTRILLGIFSGLLGTLAAYASEICSDEHRPFSLSLLNGMWGVGLVIGPGIGGYLSQPAGKYEFFKGTIFERYPYFLPPLVVSISGLLLTFLIIRLPETLHKHGKFELDQQDENTSSNSILRNYPFWSSNTIFCIWAFEEMCYTETFSLWAVGPAGLRLASEDVGLILGISGCFLLLFTLFIYPIIARRFTPIVVARGGALFVLPLFIAYPFLPRLQGQAAFYIVSVVTITKVCISALTTASLFLLINNSVTQSQRGTANGVNTSMVSFARALGPIVGGMIFSFAQSRPEAAFLPGIQLLYFFLAAITVVVIVGTLEPILPLSTNTQVHVV